MTKLINVGYRWTEHDSENTPTDKTRPHWVNPEHIVHVSQVSDQECQVAMIPGTHPHYIRTACGINELLSMLQ